MPPKSTRRDFLQGKPAARAMADGAGKATAETESRGRPKDPSAESYAIHISRRAMGCEFEVVLNAGQYENRTEAALEALDLVEALEGQMSVFRPTSEISRVNQTGGDGPVEIEPGLFGLLELAVSLHAETDGAFDISSAPLWKVWGFSRRAGRVPSDEELAEAMRCVGSQFVELDAEKKTVHLRQPGVELNLGSIGKGYALDRAAEVLTGAGVNDFLLHGGQSSVLARGSRMKAPDAAASCGGWTVGIGHPLRPGKRLAEIRLADRTLATSGSGTQFFRHQGRRYSHILDPRTGRPAEGVLSATVIAPNATLADALSTAFYVMGPDKAREYCQSRPELAAVLVCPTGRAPGFEIRSIGLEENELTLLDAR